MNDRKYRNIFKYIYITLFALQNVAGTFVPFPSAFCKKLCFIKPLHSQKSTFLQMILINLFASTCFDACCHEQSSREDIKGRFAPGKRISRILTDRKLQVVPCSHGQDAKDLILRGFARRFSSSRALYHRTMRHLLRDRRRRWRVSLSRLKSAIRNGWRIKWVGGRDSGTVNASRQEILREPARKLDY